MQITVTDDEGVIYVRHELTAAEAQELSEVIAGVRLTNRSGDGTADKILADIAEAADELA